MSKLDEMMDRLELSTVIDVSSAEATLLGSAMVCDAIGELKEELKEKLDELVDLNSSLI